MNISNTDLLTALIDGRAELDENRVTFEALGQKRTVVIPESEIDAFFADNDAVDNAIAELKNAEQQIDELKQQIDTLKEKADKKRVFKEKSKENKKADKKRVFNEKRKENKN
jgi:cell division protein ZapA (FtsZ GTPase activity inhibitor)